MSVAAFVVALLSSAGYLALLVRTPGRRRLVAMPLVVLVVAAISMLLLMLNIREGQRPSRELRLYFSLADINVIEKVSSCIEGKVTSYCPKELLRPAAKVVAVVSRAAVGDIASLAQRGGIDSVRPLRASESSVGHSSGLTVEDAVSEIGQEAAAADSIYLIVTPRTRSESAARNAYRQLLQKRPELKERIVFVSEAALGISRDMLIPDLRLEAPSVISARGGDYKVRILGQNRTSGAIEVAGLQIASSIRAVTVNTLRIRRDTIQIESTPRSSDSLSVAPRDVLNINGTFAAGPMGSVTTHSIVINNRFGETLLHLKAITRVEKPVLGLLRANKDDVPESRNDFKRFAQASGVEAADVFLDFVSLADPAKQNQLAQSYAENLALWGMLVVSEPLTAPQGKILLDVLKRIPQAANPPSLLFVGGGDSQTLFQNFTDPRMMGWQTFLAPLGIRDISGTRKILVAVDQSGSLRAAHSDVEEAVKVLFDPELGFGARDANLLVCFCGAPIDGKRICKPAELKSQIGAIFDKNDWEGSEHLITLNAFAKQQATRLFSGSGKFTDVSDLILFWDGGDIAGLNGGDDDRYLSGAAASQLPELVAQNIKIHIATFKSKIVDNRVAGYEELSRFGGADSGARFRDSVVKSVIRRGLAVEVGNVDKVGDIARQRLLALKGRDVQVINSLFGANTLPQVEAAGAVVPLVVRHPSGFSAPLMALKDPVGFDPDASGMLLNLKVGYLGIDLASEFAAIAISGDQDRRNSVGNVVYAAVDAMGAQLRAPLVSWRIDGNHVTAIRDDFLPFNLTDSLQADIRGFEADGTLAATKAVQHAGWDELGLDRMSIDLSSVILDPGAIYGVQLSFCHVPGSPVKATSGCSKVELEIPVVGSYPTLIASANVKLFESSLVDQSKVTSGDRALPEWLAQMAYATMGIAVTIGVFLL
ncbi:hypothetical protein [Bradyrhizobium sp. CW10]|uniref:hypothetical protein n=1 Tax=Bradyrhizobium sp. CW10 TaxID=2782683 RepID=UPI001FFB74F7|nr:hypothetical protein [Bradyrhizobium sp. CW10]MCK1472845.1 hypothetical protein [Bradyrhizobium sp. CW10]